jgi:hypothetical protein
VLSYWICFRGNGKDAVLGELRRCRLCRLREAELKGTDRQVAFLGMVGVLEKSASNSHRNAV